MAFPVNNLLRLPRLEDLLGRNPFGGGGNMPRPPVEMTPEEEADYLGTIIGALQYAGETLDKPGAAIRGLLAEQPEQPEQLLNLIPFSDTLGITDPAKRVSGTQLLEKAGILGAEDPNQDWTGRLGRGAAGLGTEILLDPLSLLWGPAAILTKAGKAAQAAGRAAGKTAGLAGKADKLLEASKAQELLMGVNPAQRGEEIRKGLRGLGSVGLPFGFQWLAPEARVTFGSGEKAAQLYESAWFNPVMRTLRASWGRDLKGTWRKTEQIARELAVATAKNVEAVAQDLLPTMDGSARELAKHYDEIKEWATFNKDYDTAAGFEQAMAYIGQKNEAFGSSVHATRQQLRNLFQVPSSEMDKLDVAEKLTDGLDELVATSTKLTADPLFNRFLDLGGQSAELADPFAAHAARMAIRNPAVRKEYERQLETQLLQVGMSYGQRRLPVLANLPGGAYTINRMAMDAELSNTLPLDAVAAGTATKETTARAADLAKTAGPHTNAELENRLWQSLEKAGYDPLARPTEQLLAEHPILGHVGVKMPDPPVPGKLPPKAPELVEQLTAEQLQQIAAYEKHLWPALRREYGDDLTRVIGYKDTKGEMLSLEAGAAMGDKAVPLTLGEVANDIMARTPELTRYIRGLPEDVQKNGLFNGSWLGTWSDYMHRIADSIGNLTTIHNGLEKLVTRVGLREVPGAAPIPGLKGTAKEAVGGGGLSVADAWRSTMNTKGSSALTERGLMTFLKKHAQQVGDAVDWSDADKVAQYATTLRVPDWTTKFLNAAVAVQQPEVMGPIRQALASYTKLWRFGVTIPNPQFQSRNWVDGQWRALSQSGPSTFTPLEYVRAYRDWKRLAKGKAEAVEESLAAEVRTMYPSLMGHGHAADLGEQYIEGAIKDGKVGTTIGDLFKPFAKGYYEGHTWRETIWGNWLSPLNPNIRGMEGHERIATRLQRDARQNIFGEVGDVAYKMVEEDNRIPMYIALRRKGHTAAEARQLVMETQYDYTRLSPAARTMRDAVPFVNFMQQNIPWQLEQLVNHPGGLQAQTLRASNVARQQTTAEGYSPSFLKEKQGLRVGGDDTAAHVVREFGLSIEGALAPFVSRTYRPDFLGGRKIIGPSPEIANRLFAQTNPILSTAYKLMSGKDPYTGRELETMHGIAGFEGWQATVAESLPISRQVRTAMTLADERKPWMVRALDVATGMKIGTYNFERARAQDIANALKAELARTPNVRTYERPYVPEEDKPNITPRTKRQLDLYKTAMEKLQEQINAEKKKRAAEKTGL